ncbi:helix-turn-helix transcriptional regulator [Streptomyces sp. NPDC048255]|uniref:helix-turn-helix domain-containing protein n=1 Tax=Streptomyces sp. NPDC048255 TaxID=3154713 RepID=UPI0033F4DDE4
MNYGCDHCGIELAASQGRTGRPQKYCGSACRQAAHRQRRTATPHSGRPKPQTSQYVSPAPQPSHASAAGADDLTEITKDLQESTRELLRLLTEADTGGEDPLTRVAQIQQQLEGLTAGLVGRARKHRVTWGRISGILGISQDTARHRYTDEFIQRRIARLTSQRTTAHNPPRQPVPQAGPQSQPPQHATPTKPADAQTGPPTSNGAAYNRLAPVLSMLVRTSKQANKDISAKIGCSPSYLSRILSGERLPTWSLTEKFARACGADPAVLRAVWVTERCSDRTRDSGPPGSSDSPVPAVDALRQAVHTLHARAGLPAAQDIAVASRWTLTTDDVANLIEGTQLPTWRALKLFVDLLGGDASHFHRLLDEAEEEHAEGRLASIPPPAKTKQPSAVEALAAFSDTFNQPTILESQRARLLEKRAKQSTPSTGEDGPIHLRVHAVGD